MLVTVSLILIREQQKKLKHMEDQLSSGHDRDELYFKRLKVLAEAKLNITYQHFSLKL
jgi:hypothetical protein